MKAKFGSELNYWKINRNLKKNCIVFWTITILCGMKYCIIIVGPDLSYLIYIISLFFLYHISNAQAIQLYIFLNGIEVRMKLLEKSDFKDKKFEFRNALRQIFYVWKKVYKCIGVPMVLSFLSLIVILVVNFYWIFLSFTSDEATVFWFGKVLILL
jgi:hypothetical protein